MEIRFGTDGWRALIGDAYTFENVRRVAQATATFWKSDRRKKLECYSWKPGAYACAHRPYERGMVVGYDARFLSEDFALEAARVLSANAIPVILSKSIAPTPAVSHAIQRLNLSGGVMITASHNPYRYNGFKIKMEFAGSAFPEVTREIERELEKMGGDHFSIKTEPSAPIKKEDLLAPYLEAVKSMADVGAIHKRGFRVLADPMFGANMHLLKRAIPRGEVDQIHDHRDPMFGGINPEPIDVNLKELMQKVPSQKADAGIAFDGDGDRIGAVDERGNFLSSHEIFCLLLWHLAKNKKWAGGVAKTFSTTNRVKLLANHFKLPFHETPIGFKHIAKLFLTEDILIGGEESGGIGIKNHIPERDSLLNALLLLELMAFTGKRLGEILTEIHQTIGEFHTDRIDLHLSPEDKDALLARLTKHAPSSFEGLKVEDASTLDGVKYLFEGHAWILFRPSGTEPLIRIYAEAGSKSVVKKLLQKGKALAEETSHAGAHKN